MSQGLRGETLYSIDDGTGVISAVVKEAAHKRMSAPGAEFGPGAYLLVIGKARYTDNQWRAWILLPSLQLLLLLLTATTADSVTAATAAVDVAVTNEEEEDYLSAVVADSVGVADATVAAYRDDAA